MTADPDLWRASVTTTGFAMPEVPEAIEDEALSVSMFELEDAASADPVGWQIDLLFREPPDPDQLAARVGAGAGRGRGHAGADHRRAGGARGVGTGDRAAPAAGHRRPLRRPRLACPRPVARPAPCRSRSMPGLAFGSGEHATTQSCLIAIDRLRAAAALRARAGCRLRLRRAGHRGRQVLARRRCSQSTTTRSRCGSRGPMPSSTASAGACATRARRRLCATRSSVAARPYDLILANILADPLIELAPALRAHLAPGRPGRPVRPARPPGRRGGRRASAPGPAAARPCAAGPLDGAGAGPICSGSPARLKPVPRRRCCAAHPLWL